MRYYLIAGEASGDLHAAHLMHALRQQDAAAEFRFIGGNLMAEQGGELVRHYQSLAYMGFVPVITHLPTILRGMRECRKDVVTWNPDVLILVDYPGFNLSIAQYVRKHAPGIKIFYYISPKIWAWKERRIRQIRSAVDRVYSILPFEVDYFRNRHQYDIDYVGNPTVDEIRQYQEAHEAKTDDFIKENGLDSRPLIALLAGSRKQEIRDNLRRMIEAVAPLTDKYQVVVAGAPGITKEFYAEYTGGTPVRVLHGQTYAILQHSTAALVTSGTATLETAIFRVPQVVCYYLSMYWFYRILRRLFMKIPFISLVNLIASREVVTELVGDDMSASRVRSELESILPGGERRETMLRDYDEVARRLGEPGAPQRAARLMIARLKSV